MKYESENGFTRWAPLLVVLAVVGGFVTLSWYAYHAGIQSVKEEDLVVVEADKTPIKEKPADPGGMQFPNQDKTVFETFAGNKQAPAKVERVLPVPEEPLPREMDASETTTWINENLPKQGAKEQVIGKEPAKKPAANPVKNIPVADEKTTYADLDKPGQNGGHQVIAAQTPPEEEQSVTYVAPKQAASAKPARPAETKPAETTFTPTKAPEKKPGAFMVQLGAYRSQAEADEAWGKMHIRQKELSDKQPNVVKADLGDKGIYYRLRVGGLASAEEAKALCKALESKGQPCILPTGK